MKCFLAAHKSSSERRALNTARAYGLAPSHALFLGAWVGACVDTTDDAGALSLPCRVKANSAAFSGGFLYPGAVALTFCSQAVLLPSPPGLVKAAAALAFSAPQQSGVGSSHPPLRRKNI